jgi:hypothetical protein
MSYMYARSLAEVHNDLGSINENENTYMFP